MSKLVERAMVKDALGIARADTLYDTDLDLAIEQASDEAQLLCRRKFAKALRTEYYRSYEQWPGDQDCQYSWLDGPLDLAVRPVITYASNQDHDSNGVLLEEGQDYRIDVDESLIVYSSFQAYFTRIFLMARNFIQFSPTGFRIVYTGGYPVNVKPELEPVDPLDDYGVVAVPSGLKSVLVQKIQRDWTESKMVKPWTEEERYQLKPWMKKDVI